MTGAASGVWAGVLASLLLISPAEAEADPEAAPFPAVPAGRLGCCLIERETVWANTKSLVKQHNVIYKNLNYRVYTLGSIDKIRKMNTSLNLCVLPSIILKSQKIYVLEESMLLTYQQVLCTNVFLFKWIHPHRQALALLEMVSPDEFRTGLTLGRLTMVWAGQEGQRSGKGQSSACKTWGGKGNKQPGLAINRSWNQQEKDKMAQWGCYKPSFLYVYWNYHVRNLYGLCHVSCMRFHVSVSLVTWSTVTMWSLWLVPSLGPKRLHCV